MARTYTQIRTNTFKEVQLGAGVILKTFEPGTGTISASDILFASTGGFNFSDTPTYMDMGADIDNCPKNTKELKQIESREVKLTGSAVTATPEVAKMLIGAADVAAEKITPRDVLKAADFDDIWWVGDYGDTDGGMVAIHMMNALSTDGFSIQTVDKDKGKYNFGFTAHYSIADMNTVPYEVYIKAGT